MTFLAEEKYNQAFLGVCFLRIREKKWKSNPVPVVILVLKSKALYHYSFVQLSAIPAVFLLFGGGYQFL